MNTIRAVHGCEKGGGGEAASVIHSPYERTDRNHRCLFEFGLAQWHGSKVVQA